jgi:hypothetical protein
VIPPYPAAHQEAVPPALPSGRQVLFLSLATVLLGVVGGTVWLLLADPARWEARDGGIVLTEAASRGQFQVVVVFVIVGLVGSLCAGWGIAQLLPDVGWLLTPVVIVVTSLAALIAWRLGVALGPPSPTSVRGVQPGDTLPAQLAVDAVAPFLVWPIFGLLGALAATWSSDRRA